MYTNNTHAHIHVHCVAQWNVWEKDWPSPLAQALDPELGGHDIGGDLGQLPGLVQCAHTPLGRNAQRGGAGSLGVPHHLTLIIPAGHLDPRLGVERVVPLHGVQIGTRWSRVCGHAFHSILGQVCIRVRGQPARATGYDCAVHTMCWGRRSDDIV